MSTADSASVTALTTPSTPALYTVAQVVVLVNYSRQVYELIRSGRLETVNEGRSRRVPAEAITDYVNLLKREAKKARCAEAA